MLQAKTQTSLGNKRLYAPKVDIIIFQDFFVREYISELNNFNIYTLKTNKLSKIWLLCIKFTCCSKFYDDHSGKTFLKAKRTQTENSTVQNTTFISRCSCTKQFFFLFRIECYIFLFLLKDSIYSMFFSEVSKENETVVFVFF